MTRNRRWQFDARSAGIGSALTLVAVGVLGATLVALTPVELYRAAPATEHPVPGKRYAIKPPVTLPPCDGEGKDCTEIETTPVLPDGFVWPEEFGPPPVVLLPGPEVGRQLPEPGTLALLAVAAVAAAWRMK